MSLQVNPKVLIARRCFADAQSLLQNAPQLERITGTWETGWYDTSLSPEVGSFAIVNPGDSLAGLVGRVIRVSAQERACFVYVVGSEASLLRPIALQRRAFLALGLLSKTSLTTVVEVVS
jgi:hypothetical protein